MTHEDIDAELRDALQESDALFDRLQPTLVADLRAAGVSDKDMPDMLADVHGEYWKLSRDLLARGRQRLGLTQKD